MEILAGIFWAAAGVGCVTPVGEMTRTVGDGLGADWTDTVGVAEEGAEAGEGYIGLPQS
ncbi:hypothetical protein KEJ39_02970 [Candidatus Bathyarchaeota archaeon]|nr:hypothetical protein [Candidatus Bathyarchaeota archaeon]